MMVSYAAGSAQVKPAANSLIRGHAAIVGWPTSPKLEELHNARFAAADEAAQVRIGQETQRLRFE